MPCSCFVAVRFKTVSVCPLFMGVKHHVPHACVMNALLKPLNTLEYSQNVKTVCHRFPFILSGITTYPSDTSALNSASEILAVWVLEAAKHVSRH